MKKSELKKLIKEHISEIHAFSPAEEPEYGALGAKDEIEAGEERHEEEQDLKSALDDTIGKFFVVMKPGEVSDDIDPKDSIHEVDVMGFVDMLEGCDRGTVHGFYKKENQAVRSASRLIKEMNKALAEETKMKEQKDKLAKEIKDKYSKYKTLNESCTCPNKAVDSILTEFLTK